MAAEEDSEVQNVRTIHEIVITAFTAITMPPVLDKHAIRTCLPILMFVDTLVYPPFPDADEGRVGTRLRCIPSSMVEPASQAAETMEVFTSKWCRKPTCTSLDMQAMLIWQT
ncbi:hypothetical protein E4U30_002618 [Claviceps sp. LM220 group G6]|nr:hypothetical protein E4U30_002618 [Claviceps sp. LM220 group G6]KAG6109242.1 hypothetical protein E4U31_007057 [Claviceps sp. LM219 group G6]